MSEELCEVLSGISEPQLISGKFSPAAPSELVIGEIERLSAPFSGSASSPGGEGKFIKVSLPFAFPLPLPLPLPGPLAIIDPEVPDPPVYA